MFTIAKKRPTPDGFQPRKPKNSKNLKLSHPEASSKKEQPPVGCGVKKRKKRSKRNVSSAVESGIVNGGFQPEEAKSEPEAVGELPAATLTKKERKRKFQEERALCTVFLGNLPSSWKRKVIKKFFSKYGAVESLSLRGVSANEELELEEWLVPGHSRISGLLSFKDRQSAVSALQANGIVMAGHCIQVDWAVHYAPDGHDRRKTIFVFDIPCTSTKKDLRTLFESCGAVESLHFFKDLKVLKGRGLARVHFELHESAILALKMDGVDFKGGKIHIKLSQTLTPEEKNKVKQINVAMDKISSYKKRVKLSKKAVSGGQATEGTERLGHSKRSLGAAGFKIKRRRNKIKHGKQSKEAINCGQARIVSQETNFQARSLSETKKLKKASNAETLAPKVNGVQMEGGGSQISDRPTGVKKRKKEAKQNGIQGRIAEVSQSAGKLKKQVKKATSTGQVETVQHVEPSSRAKKAKLQGKPFSGSKNVKDGKKAKLQEKMLSAAKKVKEVKKAKVREKMPSAAKTLKEKRKNNRALQKKKLSIGKLAGLKKKKSF